MKCSDKIYPPVSDEVHTETQTWNEEMSSYFQMKCSDSDIPPSFRWSAHWDPNLKWGNEFIFSDEVLRFRYTPLWNYHWQDMKCWLIYVFNESPFNRVAELGQVFRWGEQLGQLVRWSAHWDQIYPPVSDEVHTETQTWNEFIFSDEVLRFRYNPPFYTWSEQLGKLYRWGAHWDQIYYDIRIGNL